MRSALTTALTFLLASCATMEPRAADPVGSIYSYVRSNSDGSEAETIHVYRASETRVEVTKMRARCTDAAFVTAEFDLPHGEAQRLVGGRLLPNAGHRDVAVMELDFATRRLAARLDLPDGPAEVAIHARGAPWLLYDFDLADLTILNQFRPNQREDFDFGVALFWNDGDPREAFRWLGSAQARYVGEEVRGGRAALRFAVTGPPFDAEGGTVWFDATGGHVVAADFARPNHAEYRDYRLRMTGVSNGADAWRRLLAAHYGDCPAR